MSQALVTIEIVDEASLLAACDLLHDAWFDLSKARFDEQAGTWQAVLAREFFEDSSLIIEEPGIFFTKLTFPMAECTLEFEGLSACEIHDISQIGTYMFNECRPVEEGYRLVFCEDMEMLFKFKDRPKGCLRDIKLLEERGTHSVLRNPFRRRPTTESRELLHARVPHAKRWPAPI